MYSYRGYIHRERTKPNSFKVHLAPGKPGKTFFKKTWKSSLEKYYDFLTTQGFFFNFVFFKFKISSAM